MTKVASMISTLAENFPAEMFSSWHSHNSTSFFEQLFNLTRQLLQLVSNPDNQMDHDSKERYLEAFNDLLNAWVLFGTSIMLIIVIVSSLINSFPVGSPLTPYGASPVMSDSLLQNYGGGVFEDYVRARLAIAQKELFDLEEDLDDAPDDVVCSCSLQMS